MIGSRRVVMSVLALAVLAEVASAGQNPGTRNPDLDWVSLPVPGTNMRVWIKGTEAALRPYVQVAGQVWERFPQFFTYPMPDIAGNPSAAINPDSAIDFYFLKSGEIDPRLDMCRDSSANRSAPDWQANCALSNTGQSRPEGDRVRRTSSGHVLVRIPAPPEDLIRTIAHELTHVSQFSYDKDDMQDSWLKESTANFVAFKVMKSWKLEPEVLYNDLDPDRPQREGYLPLFGNLNASLYHETNSMSAWLFFQSAAMDLGDDIAKLVWEKASPAYAQREDAVNEAIPFETHLPRFAVRTWHQNLVGSRFRYETGDPTFRHTLKPTPAQVHSLKFEFPHRRELVEPVRPLASQYYSFTFAESIRSVTFENLFRSESPPMAHARVWTIANVAGSGWQEPQDWSDVTVKRLCRDNSDENVSELIVIVTNVEVTRAKADFPSGPRPRVVAGDVGCPPIEGSAQATLEINDEAADTKIKYVSSTARLRFRPRSEQEVTGATVYDLLPTSVTWTASGTLNGCTLSGQVTVKTPDLSDRPRDEIVTQPSHGYLNVIGDADGSNHSVVIRMTRVPGLTKTCPGSPPQVTQEDFPGSLLLQVLGKPNERDGNSAVYRGSGIVDPGDFEQMLSGSALRVWQGQAATVPSGNARGPDLQSLEEMIRAFSPEAADSLARARQEMAQTPSNQYRLTMQWNLKPVSRAGAP